MTQGRQRPRYLLTTGMAWHGIFQLDGAVTIIYSKESLGGIVL